MPASLPSRRQQSPEGLDQGVRFVPAGWLVAALGVSRLLLRGGKLGKLGIAGLVWTVAPRKLKLVAFGFVLAALVMIAGAMAAIALLAIELS
jgi:hypothetical protein